MFLKAFKQAYEGWREHGQGADMYSLHTIVPIQLDSLDATDRGFLIYIFKLNFLNPTIKSVLARTTEMIEIMLRQ